jgi:hypothetical protein
LSVARNAALGGLLWSGDYRRYSERLREWTIDAQDRGDMNSLSVYRMNRSPLSLAEGDPLQASEDLDEAERILSSAWQAHGVHVPHVIGLLGRAGVAIYEGRAAAEYERLHERLKAVRTSPLSRVQTLAILMLLQEATLSVAAACELPATSRRGETLLKRASACAAGLRRIHAVWSLGLALSIEAGVLTTTGRAESAQPVWLDAEREFRRAGMRLYAAAARRKHAAASGDKDALRAADAAFLDQNVREPERMANVLMPARG